MKIEKININRKETSIKLQASEINSIRVKDIERSAVRVYDKGMIGISGAVGVSSEEELVKQAVDNLSSNISYSYELESNNKDHRNYIKKHHSEKDLMTLTEYITSSLRHEFGDFIFSESIQNIEMDYSLTNTEGLDLRYQDEHLEIGLIVKAKNSSNLFDTIIGWEGRNLDVEKFLSNVKKQLIAERTKIELPEEERIPVFFLSLGSIGTFLLKQLNGETYGNKASLFNGKIEEKLFNDKLTIVQSKDPITTYSIFFDAEGVTKENDSVTLIENGILKHVFTDKKNSKKFNLEHTGSASGGYDDVPSLGFTNILPLIDTEHINKVLKGQKAILAVLAAGGEVNAEGNYATPVQASYLYDGKNILGKLPEFSMSNNIYNMLGNDYLGTFPTDGLYFGEHDFLLGSYMNIKK